MRHIPEEELHANLDQALSRSQCVEIESHLAGCRRCRMQRDDIAALRDRTTALLSSLGPTTTLPPPFEVIRARHDRAQQLRRRWVVAGAWAASVVLALAGGWGVDQWLHGSAAIAEARTAVSRQPGIDRPAGVALPIATPSGPAVHALVHSARNRKAMPEPAVAWSPAQKAASPFSAQAPLAGADSSRSPGTEPLDTSTGEQLALEVFSLPNYSPLSNLDGLWRTVPLAYGENTPVSQVPHVAGLPVVQVQVQKASPEGEITAVEQQLATGEVIRTIEGPASKVSALLAHRDEAGPQNGADSSSSPQKGDMTLTVRSGDRMLAVTGPSTVLGSLMSRVNLRRRY